MKVSLIPIGNSRGIRLPRTVIDECGFGKHIELRVEHGTVVLAPVRATREGWGAAFERMAAASDDTLLIPDKLAHDWDDEEWEW